MADSLVTSIPFSNAREQIISNLVSSADELISVNIPIYWGSSEVSDGQVLATYTPTVTMRYIAFIGYDIPHSNNSYTPVVNPIIFTPNVTNLTFNVFMPSSNGSGYIYTSFMTFTSSATEISVIFKIPPGSSLSNYNKTYYMSGLLAIFS